MIYTIGEALIDMIPINPKHSISKAEGFYKYAGGAPANVAAAISKLGGKSAFISKVGDDGFGRFIVNTLNEYNVDTSKVFYTKDRFTGIIYVAIAEDGNREFCGMRQNSADLFLNADEIQSSWFSRGDYLHFCSVSLVDAPVRYAHIKALESIIEVGGKVSFDLNLRFMLWENPKDCIDIVWEFMKYPNYLKISDDEYFEMLGDTPLEEGINKFFERGERLEFIIYTCGADGAQIYYPNGLSYSVPAMKVDAIDTTGAGDCYIAAILCMLQKINREPDHSDMIEIMRFASKCVSLQIQSVGAMTSVPTYEQVVSNLEFTNF